MGTAGIHKVGIKPVLIVSAKIGAIMITQMLILYCLQQAGSVPCISGMQGWRKAARIRAQGRAGHDCCREQLWRDAQEESSTPRGVQPCS